VVQACRRNGKSAGIHIVMPEQDAVTNAIRQGFTFIALGVDTVFLAAAARTGLESAIANASAQITVHQGRPA